MIIETLADNKFKFFQKIFVFSAVASQIKTIARSQRKKLLKKTKKLSSSFARKHRALLPKRF